MLLALTGCSSQKTPRSALDSAPLPTPAQVARDVAALRRLPDARPARVEFVEERRFLQEYLGANAEPPPKATPGAAFAPAPIGLREVLGEQVIAYYSRRSHRIAIRGGQQWDSAMVDLFAHELTHSLQAQNLPLPKLTDESADASLAREALLEGDAMLVMLAYASWRQRVPINRALSRAAAMLADVGFERYLRASGGNQVLYSAPPAVRERVTFPYTRGLMFAGDIWRTGGFELLNKVYEAPPVSSEQVMHPQKYLSGELPVPVATPTPPKDAAQVKSGRLGEHGIRVLFEQGMPAAQAATAAAGWGGDAFSFFQRANAPALLWATTWDSEQDAREFQIALARYAAAAGSVLSGEGRSMLRRHGQHVVFAEGVDVGGRDEIDAELTALIGAVPAARAPFGALTVPPLRRPPPTRPPFVTPDGVYVNEYLGLVARVPPGGSAQLRSATSAVFSLEGEVTAFGGIELSEQIAGRDTIDDVHGAIRDVVAEALGKHKLEYTGGREIYLEALGHAVERSWRVKGTSAGLSVVVVPICRGSGSFVFWRFYADVPGSAVMQGWLDSLRPTAWSVPPVCAVLDP